MDEIDKSRDSRSCDLGVTSDSKDKKVKKSLYPKNLNGITDYLTSKVKRAFTQLKQKFTKAAIFWHFDLKCHIQIKPDTSSYAIGNKLSQLINLG